MSELLDEGPSDEAEGIRIAAIGADLTLKQIFTYGYFHADPHPGNILVLEDGKLCYVDFGLTGNPIQRDREVVSDMLISMMSQNEQKTAKAVIRLAGSRDYQAAQKIEREIAQLIDPWTDRENPTHGWLLVRCAALRRFNRPFSWAGK